MSDEDDYKHARGTDPETSHEGAKYEREKDRAVVHAELHKAGQEGLCDFELERRLGGAMNGKWRKRRDCTGKIPEFERGKPARQCGKIGT